MRLAVHEIALEWSSYSVDVRELLNDPVGTALHHTSEIPRLGLPRRDDLNAVVRINNDADGFTELTSTQSGMRRRDGKPKRRQLRRPGRGDFAGERFGRESIGSWVSS